MIESVLDVLTFQVPVSKVEREAIDLTQCIIDSIRMNMPFSTGDSPLRTNEKLKTALLFMWQCIGDKSSVTYVLLVHSFHDDLHHRLFD